MIVGISKRFNNQGMKVQVNRAFKSYSFFQPPPSPQKKKNKADGSYKCTEVLQSPISKSTTPFSAATFSSKNILTPVQGQQNGKQC